MKRFILTMAFIFAISFCITNAFADNTAKSKSGSTSAAGASINFDDHSTSKSKITDRDFVGSSPSVTAGTHALFMQNTGDDVSFRRVQELVKYGNIFSENSLKILAKGGDVEGHFSSVNDFEKPEIEQADGQRYIMIAIVEPDSFRMTALFDKEADDIETNSFQLIAKAALDAIKNGDNILFVEFEGWKDKVNASGWGIGTHTAVGAISDSGKASGVGGGGFGISANEVGSEKKPWIRGYAGCLPTMLDISGNNVIRTKKKVYTSSDYDYNNER